MNNVLSPVGRILVAVVFILSAFSQIGSFQSTINYMTVNGIPLAPLFLYGAIFLEVTGGIMVALGYKTKFGIYMLLAFLIPTTIIFHAKSGDRFEMVHLLKNLSILGALIFMLANGPGKAAVTKD